MIAAPITWPIDGLELGDVDAIAFCHASGGTGRAMMRSRTSAVVDAASTAAANRCRTLASARSISRSGQLDDEANRPTATAVAGRATAWPRSIDTPGQIVRRAFSASAATWRFVTISQSSSPPRWTTRNSIEGQPTRQASKPRRCRGCNARINSTDNSESGVSPTGGEMTRETASAAPACS